MVLYIHLKKKGLKPSKKVLFPGILKLLIQKLALLPLPPTASLSGWLPIPPVPE